MISLSAFIKKYTGKTLDFDGVYGGQCVDVAKAWNKNLGYKARYGNGNAWIGLAGNEYTRINYNAKNPLTRPRAGDIISWRAGSPADPKYGHVAVVVKGGLTSFTSFDQNWGSPRTCRKVVHKYTGVQGWLRPKRKIVV